MQLRAAIKPPQRFDVVDRWVLGVAARDPLDRHWRSNLAAALETSSLGRQVLQEIPLRAWLSQR